MKLVLKTERIRKERKLRLLIVTAKVESENWFNCILLAHVLNFPKQHRLNLGPCVLKEFHRCCTTHANGFLETKTRDFNTFYCPDTERVYTITGLNYKRRLKLNYKIRLSRAQIEERFEAMQYKRPSTSNSCTPHTLNCFPDPFNYSLLSSFLKSQLQIQILKICLFLTRFLHDRRVEHGKNS